MALARRCATPYAQHFTNTEPVHVPQRTVGTQRQSGTLGAMTKKEISPEVRRFVLTSIPSVPHMEALMLLRSTTPAQWSARELAQRL